MDKKGIYNLVIGLYRNQIIISEQLIEICGSITEAMMLSKLLQFDEHSAKWEEFEGLEGKWFYFTSDNWAKFGLEKDMRLSAQKKLVEKGLITVIRRGIPAQNYYQVNQDNFVDMLVEINNRPDVGKTDIKISENPTTGSRKIRHHTYIEKETYKEKEKEFSSSTFVPTTQTLEGDDKLEELSGKSRDFKPDVKKLMEVLGVYDSRAREISKELKGLGLIQRREHLKDIVKNLAEPSPESHKNNFGYKDTQKQKESYEQGVQNELNEYRKTLKEGGEEVIDKVLDHLAEIYKKETGYKPTVTDEFKLDYMRLRKKGVSPETIKRYVEGLFRVVRETEDASQKRWYSVPFPQVLKEKTVEMRISNPLVMQQNGSI